MKFRGKFISILCVMFSLLGCSEKEIIENIDKDDNPPEEKTSLIYDAEWTASMEKHYHACLTEGHEDEKIGNEDHDFTEWGVVVRRETCKRDFINDYAPSLSGGTYYSRQCKTCSYIETMSVIHGERVTQELETDYRLYDQLPQVRFTTNEGISFATDPTDKTDKPEVVGKYQITNCPDEFKLNDIDGYMKVRGNQTARFKKKGFRIKFDKKQSLFDLNGGKSYKKWVLFADAKDSSLLRTAVGLYLSKQICGESAFVSDFIPVNLYINNNYWGCYILGEQKEVKEGRINLPEVAKNYEGTDIGYCFELDNYASKEAGEDADPTFTVEYKPAEIKASVESGSSNVIQHGYTMLSDITNDAQLSFIKDKVETLYTYLYERTQFKEVANNTKDLGANEKTLQAMENEISQYFDIDSFADAYLLNEIACDPDVGYSSFFLSLDMSSEGSKKLRADCPWDWDSAFGIRKNCMENPKGEYLKKSTNMWFNLFSKFSFFQNKVRAKWKKIRSEYVPEKTIKLMEDCTEKYASDYSLNFEKWPNCLGKNFENKSELRDAYLNVNNQQEAVDLLKQWFIKRIDNIESRMGANWASLETGYDIPVMPNTTEFKKVCKKVRLEGENATLSGGCGTNTSTRSEVSGGKYVNNLNGHAGSKMTFKYTMDEELRVLLSVGVSARDGVSYDFFDLFKVSVNGTECKPDYGVELPAGVGGKDFQYWMNTDLFYSFLEKGEHTIVIEAKQTSTNFDYLDLYIPVI